MLEQELLAHELIAFCAKMRPFFFLVAGCPYSNYCCAVDETRFQQPYPGKLLTLLSSLEGRQCTRMHKI